MRKIFLIACILSLLILPNLSQSVEVDVVPFEVQTFVNEPAAYTIEIYNDKTTKDEYIITVFGNHMEWLNLAGYYVEMDRHENKFIEMYFLPKEEGSYEYEILVYSKKFSNNLDSEEFSLRVYPERFITFDSFSSRRVDDNFVVDIELYAKQKMELEINFEISDSEGNVVRLVEVTREVNGDESFTENIPIGNLLAGDYDLRMTIPEHDVTREVSFYIQPVHNVVKKKEIVSSPFGQEIIITVTNEGNVVEDYNVRENIPATEYVDLESEPSSSFVEGDEVNYNWKIDGLVTGGTTTITYAISNIPKIIGSVIIVICVLGILAMGTMKVGSPKIRKRYARRRDGHRILIEINGSLIKEIKNVLVKDRVSPLGKVLPEFEGPRPIVREGEAGTELIWRLGDIKPRSEIYLTYKVRPLIQAQLKMPRAYLSYRTDDDKKVRVFSKQIILE